MQRFKALEQARRFLTVFGPICNHFRPRRHLLPAAQYRQEMRSLFRAWREVTGLATCA